MQITVSGGIIRVDGVQYGTKYSSHSLAVNIAHQIKDKHYPHANFTDFPEPQKPIQLPIVHHRKQKAVANIATPSLQLAYA